MAEERILIVPIRKYLLNAPTWRRSKRAVSVLRKFVMKHTKAKEVKIGRWVNEYFWQHGAKNPPGKVKVIITKNKDIISVELAELPKRAQRINAKHVKVQEKKKKLLEKAKEILTEAKAEKAAEKPNEEDKQKAKMTKEEEKFMQKAKMTKEEEKFMH